MKATNKGQKNLPVNAFRKNKFTNDNLAVQFDKNDGIFLLLRDTLKSKGVPYGFPAGAIAFPAVA